MPSKDYKDALNDIRLSSEFCAKMEEKLSKDIFEDDEYEEVENHVEVIEHKGFRKYMAAAAVIAVIGAVGGGYIFGLRLFPCLLQIAVAQDAGRLFTAEPVKAGIFVHISAPGKERDAGPGTVIPDKSFVPIRFRATQPVIEVGGGNLPSGIRRQRKEKVQ